ncbi:enoyl-CoA hydratase/isomerase family protein [Bradyrhizobium prioriisuperbiae]|uniref:enoyl-CoA hydratase/isomerase family protein n=1 Tax=Bradyrhizobium prioriisuperbiae TaxID=2854389 RepID=UPI0028EB6B50|nr:enoyl-CoA hydratase-related protein [Bradyrhizobium prioritasuperba]
MEFDCIDLQRRNGLVQIQLNRPESGNSMNVALLRQLAKAMRNCEEDENVRCVVLTGKGRFFCVGGDPGNFDGADDYGAVVRETTHHLNAAILSMVRMRAPVVVSINGPAAGAGLSLCLAGDIVLASASATFASAFIALGLPPDGGLARALFRRVGETKAREMLMLNRKITAAEAFQWGMINNVVDAAGLPSAVDEICNRFMSGPTVAYGRIKALLAGADQFGLEHQLQLEAKGVAESVNLGDGLEGIRAFREKRAARFTGL